MIKVKDWIQANRAQFRTTSTPSKIIRLKDEIQFDIGDIVGVHLIKNSQKMVRMAKLVAYSEDNITVTLTLGVRSQGTIYKCEINDLEW